MNLCYKTIKKTPSDDLILSILQAFHCSTNMVSHILGCSNQHVKNVISRNGPNKTYVPQKRGRKTVLNEEHLYYLKYQTLLNRRVTTMELTSGLKKSFSIEVSPKTVLRALKTLGFRYLPPLPSVYLTPSAKTKRV